MNALEKYRTGWRLAFILALLTGIVIFLPFIIYDKGYFIYYGDFNVQQIPFYKLAHEAVRSGDVLWNWYTDLGVNFIGSYSFYLLFSPFFWLTLPFPTSFVPHLMAPLLILKSACAALTAFLYLRRFVKEESYAVIGSLLYAFSGWMQFNIFFNHFHEVAVFFPLLLLAVEKLVTENKRGWLVAAVAVNAMVNYWFFAGEAIFVILYVLVRRTDRDWGLTLKKFAFIAAEAVLGLALAGVVVLPSVMALMGNPRTGSDELLSGWNLWLYWHEQRQPAIIQSLFFPPEHPARPNFLPDHGAKWASLSAWLPLFSMTGVLAYFFRRRDDWLKKLLALCLVFALVPMLNNMFILFNDSYYARWFYMPILLMALATARALEDAGPGHGPDATADYARSVKWTAIVLIVYTVMCGLTPNRDTDGLLVFGLADDPVTMWIFAAVAMVSLAAVAVLILRLRSLQRFAALSMAGVMLVTAGFSLFYIANGKNNRSRSQWMIDRAILGREEISLPDDGVWRVDVHEGTDNIAMYWHLPTIQAFHSIVPPSIMEFYPLVGVTRDVGSRPEAEHYALRPLLSVRWLFIEESKTEQYPMPGYTYYATQNGFNIYQNDNFLPIGFSYGEYVTPRQMEDVATEKRANLMLRAVVIEEEAVERLSGLLAPMAGDGYLDFDPHTMAVDVDERWQYTADSFARDRKGFTLTTSFDQPRLLFLSVPYDKGWSAKLASGDTRADLRIEKANIGFMAVQVPAGSATIRFDYQPPGLVFGAVISLGSLLAFVGYLLLTRRTDVEPGAVPDVNRALAGGQRVNLTADQYRRLYGDKKARHSHIQSAIKDAARDGAQPPAAAPPPPAVDAAPEKPPGKAQDNSSPFSFGADVMPPPFSDSVFVPSERRPTPPAEKKAEPEVEPLLDTSMLEDIGLSPESFLLEGEGISLLDEEQPPEDLGESLTFDFDSHPLSGEDSLSLEDDGESPLTDNPLNLADPGLTGGADGNTWDIDGDWEE